MANRVVSVGIPILLDSGEVIRGVKVLVPGDAASQPSPPRTWRPGSATAGSTSASPTAPSWVERFQKIRDEIAALPQDDSSSRFLRNRRFWHKVDVIQPGKVVGWILGTEEGGSRIKR